MFNNIVSKAKFASINGIEDNDDIKVVYTPVEKED